MKISRRAFLYTLPVGAAAWPTLAQVSSRHVKAQSRPAFSGRPYDAQFTDVAAKAGLTSPAIYGDPNYADYILEATGCGCAFFDYDNDGWIDVFILSGTRLAGTPQGATNRLYHNNRDGTFTDVTEKSGLQKVGWASSVCVGDYNNDGFEISSSPTTARTSFIAITATGLSQTSRRRLAWRMIRRAGAPAPRSSTTIAMDTSISSSRTT